MNAVRWHGPKDLRYEEMPPPPAPSKGWARVKIRACGIGNSDLEQYEQSPPLGLPQKSGSQQKFLPLIPGHEFCGILEKLGPETKGPAPGTSVIVDTSIPCQECYYCTNGLKTVCCNRRVLGRTIDGGFAEFANVPAQNCFPVTAKVSYEVLALAEPLTAVIHSVNRSGLRKGDKVAVIGAGPIGLMLIMVSIRRGAENLILIDPVAARRNLAIGLGANYAFDLNRDNLLAQVASRISGVGADIVFECIGGPQTYQLAINLARRRGRVMIIRSPLEPILVDFKDILMGEKEVLGSSGHDNEWEEAMELLKEDPKRWRRLISTRISLKETPSVFKAISNQVLTEPAALKIVILP